MGFSVKKAVGSVSKVAKSASKAVKGATKSASKIVKSASKGDIKGVAKGAQGLVGTAKDLGKDAAIQNLGFSTGALSALGGLTGMRDLSNFASGLNQFGTGAINQYGDPVMDIGANVATGGTYGMANQLTSNLANEGWGALLSPEALQQGALNAAFQQAGINPEYYQMLQNPEQALQSQIAGQYLPDQFADYGRMYEDALKQVPNIDENVQKLKQSGVELTKGTKGFDILGDIQRGLSSLGGSIAGGAKSVADFTRENPLLASGIAQAGTTGIAYYLGEKARKEQADALKKQLDEIRGIQYNLGKPMIADYQADAGSQQALQQAQDFMSQVAKTGFTPEQIAEQQKNLRRESQFAQGQRQAALEQQARTAGGAATGGNALAMAALGGQGAANRLAESQREIEAQAFTNQRAANQALANLANERLQREFQQARGISQDVYQSAADRFNNQMMRQGYISAAQQQQMANQAARGQSQVDLARGIGNTISTGILGANQARQAQDQTQWDRGVQQQQLDIQRQQAQQQQQKNKPKTPTVKEVITNPKGAIKQVGQQIIDQIPVGIKRPEDIAKPSSANPFQNLMGIFGAK